MENWKFTVISFFTPNYSTGAARLEASCRRFGIPSQIIPSAFSDTTQADWRHNTFAKAAFIRSQMDRIPGPLVWLDADAEIKRPPVLFNDLAALAEWRGPALAVYPSRPGRIRSGTIWLANDANSRRVVDEWMKINIATIADPGPMMDPKEQKNLWAALEKMGITNVLAGGVIYYLPLAYCRINKYFRDDRNEIESPVILHFQKSREYRGKV